MSEEIKKGMSMKFVNKFYKNFIAIGAVCLFPNILLCELKIAEFESGSATVIDEIDRVAKLVGEHAANVQKTINDPDFGTKYLNTDKSPKKDAVLPTAVENAYRYVNIASAHETKSKSATNAVKLLEALRATIESSKGNNLDQDAVDFLNGEITTVEDALK